MTEEFRRFYKIDGTVAMFQQTTDKTQTKSSVITRQQPAPHLPTITLTIVLVLTMQSEDQI